MSKINIFIIERVSVALNNFGKESFYCHRRTTPDVGKDNVYWKRQHQTKVIQIFVSIYANIFTREDNWTVHVSHRIHFRSLFCLARSSGSYKCAIDSKRFVTFKNHLKLEDILSSVGWLQTFTWRSRAINIRHDYAFDIADSIIKSPYWFTCCHRDLIQLKLGICIQTALLGIILISFSVRLKVNCLVIGSKRTASHF